MSRRTDYRTPRRFFNRINSARVNFAVDAAADESNHLVDTYYGPGGIEADALEVENWLSPAWCNPPYQSGAQWRRWLEKIVLERTKGATIFLLVPAATGTEWWMDFVVTPYLNSLCDIIFLNGRLHFTLPDREVDSPNHASALIIYSEHIAGMIGWITVGADGSDNQPRVGNAEQVDVRNQTDPGATGEIHAGGSVGGPDDGHDTTPDAGAGPADHERPQPGESSGLPLESPGLPDATGDGGS